MTTAAPQLPSRVVFYAPEKSGKTSFGCYAPKPIFAMTPGETGILSLIESGQVPPTAHFPDDFKDWASFDGAIRELGEVDHGYQTLVIDTGNGAEKLLMAEVCNREFNGSWTEFHAFGRGLTLCIPLWDDFLRQLDSLRQRRRMAVLILHHSKVKQTSNPTGKDWDQWRPEAQDKLWNLTHKWADVICFYGSRVNVNKDEKAYGTEERYLRCTNTASIVAGNRYGLPDEIKSAPGAKALWQAFAKALIAAKSKAKGDAPKKDVAPEPTPAPPPPPPAAAGTPLAHNAAPVAANAPPTEAELARADALESLAQLCGELSTTPAAMLATHAAKVGPWVRGEPLPPVERLTDQQLDTLYGIVRALYEAESGAAV